MNEELTLRVTSLANNQFVIRFADKDVFQSYRSIIAQRFHDGRIILDRGKWDYSKTTSKWRNRFLDMSTKEIKAGIKNGSIELKDLNL